MTITRPRGYTPSQRLVMQEKLLQAAQEAVALHEWARMAGHEDLQAIHRVRALKLLIEFVAFGGSPKVALTHQAVFYQEGRHAIGH